MFKFDFDIDDEDEEVRTALRDSTDQTTADVQEPEQAPCSEISLDHLLNCLPPVISYTPLSIPLSLGDVITLPRRDLFDARFQLISETKVDDEDETERTTTAGEGDVLGFIDAPSDLVPGVYEGGLKTWECSLDLVDYMKTRGISLGRRTLEIGCGTGIPSVYLFQEFLQGSILDHDPYEIHFQDYNASVLELVTFPNIFLAWYLSPPSVTFRENHSSEDKTNPVNNPSASFEVVITPELKDCFISSLQSHRMTLRFFSGSWKTFDVNAAGGCYDLVLTSETIYRSGSLPGLITLLREACRCVEPLEMSKLSLSDRDLDRPLCLVAAKVLYFGVGGGIFEFVQGIEKTKGETAVVWEQSSGVQRKILRVNWNA